MLGRRRARRRVGWLDKEGKRLSRRNGVALVRLSVFPDATRSRHAREFPSLLPPLSIYLSLFLFSFYLFLSFSRSLSLLAKTSPSRSLSLSLSLSHSPALSILAERPGARSSVFLAPSFLVLSLCAHLQDDVEARRPCPAPLYPGMRGTNRSAASGNEGAPIGIRRRRIDADERRF